MFNKFNELGNIPDDEKESHTLANSKTETKLPKRRDRESTQQKLMQAGLEVFSEFGYDCATTKLIAQKACSNESLISRYFQSKEGLLLAIIIRFIDQKKIQQLTYPPQETLEDEFVHYLNMKAAADIALKDFTKIIISRIAIDPVLNEKVRNHVSMDPDMNFVQRLQAFKDKGILPPDADLNLISFTVGFQGFATVCMAHIIMGKDLDETMNGLREFGRTYARGLQIR